MEKSRTWSRRELLRRFLLFGISLFIIAFGISIITRSDLGTSPISSVPYVASLNTPLTMGTYFFIFTIVLICMQMLLLGKRGVIERKVELLMQFPVAFVLSVFTDATMWMLHSYAPRGVCPENSVADYRMRHPGPGHLPRGYGRRNDD